MAVTVLRTDEWMPQTAALDPALLMYIRYVCTHGRGYVLSESAPDLSSVREGDLSDRLHQQDDRGTGVSSVQGPR